MQGRGRSRGGQGRHCHSVIGFVEAVAAEGKQCPVAAPALGGGDPELVEPCSVWRLRCVLRGDVCQLLSGCCQVRSRPISFLLLSLGVFFRRFFQLGFPILSSPRDACCLRVFRRARARRETLRNGGDTKPESWWLYKHGGFEIVL